ncbi:hypothetical protein KC19_VG337400 [Ceratodon purpureus]|uniref:Uncharacterized protein n=1 Tax=Ceratodon purpureus TaxID=3225 RepID=A0A8T0HW58_CERPU|nr:hypothetical protein KC19_VG337400 [Ceratodon purpureus]
MTVYTIPSKHGALRIPVKPHTKTNSPRFTGFGLRPLFLVLVLVLLIFGSEGAGAAIGTGSLPGACKEDGGSVFIWVQAP